MDSINVKLFVQNYDGIVSHLLKETYSEVPEIRETDKLSFSIICSDTRGDPKIFLQDHSITLNRKVASGTLFEYTVEYDRYLINSFGVTSIAVGFSNSEEIYRVTPLNVLARKINKEQAEKILVYLATRMEDVTNLCFSKTQIGSNSNDRSNTDTLTKLDFSRVILEDLYTGRQRFSMQPCRRYTEDVRVSSYDEGTYITDKGIAWLFQHLDQLYPVPVDAARVSIHNKNYSIDQIQKTVITIETDLFENQVIYGFLLSLKGFLLTIPDYQKKHKQNTSNDDYYNFESVLRSIEAPLLERRYKEAQKLLIKCNELISFFQKNIPCTNKGALQPRLTPQAKRYSHYERSFRLIDKWYKLGQPKWVGSNYLFGLKSLDKLYEFYCLFKISDSLLNIGFKLKRTETREADRSAGMFGRIVEHSSEKLINHYQFELEEKTIDLLYEPIIWAYSNNSKAGDLIDISHRNTDEYPYYMPDFLIKLQDSNKEPSYFLFDAKYSNESQTREKHLPNIINKYYLRLKSLDSNKKPNNSSIKLVYAIIPAAYHPHFGLHGGAFNIYDELALSPFFGFIKLSTEDDKPLERILKRSLIEIG